MSGYNYTQTLRDIINQQKQEIKRLQIRVEWFEKSERIQLTECRDLLQELHTHEIRGYGRWTVGMCQRVSKAVKAGGGSCSST